MTKEERAEKIKWLNRYLFAGMQIERLKKEQEKWRERATNVTTAPTYFKYIRDKEKLEQMTKEERRLNAMPPVIIRGGKALTIEGIVAEIDLIDYKIQAAIYCETALRNDIEQAINALEDDRERLILKYKYIDGLYLEEICVKMGYSYRHIKRLHNTGLKNIKMSHRVPLL